MKILKRLLIAAIFVVFLIPNIVFASTGTLSISSASTGVVGNTLNVSVTLSSATMIGAWQFDISADGAYLQKASNPTTGVSKDLSSGFAVKGYADNGKGYKSITYNMSFKVLKSGTATIRVNGAVVSGYDESNMTVSSASRTVTLKTQAEIEASYSSDAYLKSLSVGDYTLSPEFDKETYEYNVEVPNDVERVTINATKNDYNASVAGTGEKELQEGNNKFEITVTAQKGNSLKYVVNVERKELNPITVTINGKDFNIVRKKELLPELLGFVEDTTTYNDTEVPALFNEALNYKLIGVKDDDNNVYTYLYDEGAKEIRTQYIQLVSGEIIISPDNFRENYKGFEQKEIEIDGLKIFGLALSDKQIIINGMNPLNKDMNVYLYDIDTKTFIPFNADTINKIDKNMSIYKLIILILGVVVVLLIGLNIFKKGNKKEKKNTNRFIIDEFKEIEKEEEKIEKDIIEEIIEEEKTEDDIIKEELEDFEEEKKEEPKKEKKLSKRAKKKLKEQEKKAKEEERLLEEEKPIEDDKLDDYDKVDDPLDDDDDFMDFWETREFVIKKNKNDDEE